MSIFTFLEQQIDTLAREFEDQVNLVRTMVINPLRGNVGLVIAGYWKGNGANRFVNEMNDEILPMLEGLFIITTNFAGGIRKSEEHMDTAIRMACIQSACLMDDYLRIF